MQLAVCARRARWLRYARNVDSPIAPKLSPEPLPPRKKPSIFSWVVKIIAVVVMGSLLGVIWVVVNSPLFHRVLSVMVEQQHLMKEQRTAPGARELTKAGPCMNALVTSPDLQKRMDALARGARRRSRRRKAPADETNIMCVTPLLAHPPDCDVLARVYVDAAHPTGPFRITVIPAANAKAGCSADYDSSGTPLALDGGI